MRIATPFPSQPGLYPALNQFGTFRFSTVTQQRVYDELLMSSAGLRYVLGTRVCLLQCLDHRVNAINKNLPAPTPDEDILHFEIERLEPCHIGQDRLIVVVYWA